MLATPCAAPCPLPASQLLPCDDGSDTLELIHGNIPLVKSIAKRVYGSLPGQAGVELNDLIQAGYVGLVNASRSYRSATQVPFSTYARYRIRGEIIDSLRKLDGASRNLRSWQKQMDA